MEAAANLRKPARVLIVDDHRMFPEALEAILATGGRIKIAVTKDRIAAELVGAILEVAST